MSTRRSAAAHHHPILQRACSPLYEDDSPIDELTPAITEGKAGEIAPYLRFEISEKTSAEYDCVMQTAGRSRHVVAVTGEPLTPGLFAWITYFESEGSLRQGQFFTTLSGPRGRGRIQAQFYRAPVGATLGIWFKTGGEEMKVYNQCRLVKLQSPSSGVPGTGLRA